jgi:hypothetical protein
VRADIIWSRYFDGSREIGMTRDTTTDYRRGSKLLPWGVREATILCNIFVRTKTKTTTRQRYRVKYTHIMSVRPLSYQQHKTRGSSGFFWVLRDARPVRTDNDSK